jgi:predicted ATPase
MTSIDKIYEFYKCQPSQISNLDIIKNWFLELEQSKNVKKIVDKKVKKKKNTNPILLIIGDTGIGKTVLIGEFLKKCTYDILDIGKLFDIYESTNIYSIKDFIPKLLKQKNVSDVSNKKLLVIDSLEEFIVIQKTIIRDIIESLDTIGMPILLVSERASFDTLEKKVITK